MELWEAIKGRRSIGLVKQQMPPREHIEQMLEAANWAPNHFHTEPWRFYVLTGAARERLGEAMATILSEQMEDPHTEENQTRLQRMRNNPLRAPVLIAVVVSPLQEKRVIEVEEIEATACAVQNMMLVAQEFGLGTIWRTGDMIYKEELKHFFSLQPQERLLGLVYVGYPDQVIKPGKRRPVAEKTTWLDA